MGILDRASAGLRQRSRRGSDLGVGVRCRSGRCSVALFEEVISRPDKALPSLVETSVVVDVGYMKTQRRARSVHGRVTPKLEVR